LAPAAHAAPYESGRWLYRIDLPDDWKQIPDEQVQSMRAAGKAAGAPQAVLFDAGFQPASSKWTFDGPYALVQVVRYSALAIYHPVGENDFDNVMRLMIGRSGIRGAQLDPSQQNGAPAPTSQVGEPSLDKSNRRYTVVTEVEVQGRGKFRGLLTGYFAQDYLVQVCYYAPEKRTDLGAARGITDSLQFVAPRPVAAPPPSAGTSRRTADPAADKANQVVESARNRAVDGAILGGIIGLLSAFKARRGKRRKDDQAEQPDDAPPPPPTSPRPF
jgi:hypothetical protein